MKAKPQPFNVDYNLYDHSESFSSVASGSQQSRLISNSSHCLCSCGSLSEWGSLQLQEQHLLGANKKNGQDMVVVVLTKSDNDTAARGEGTAGDKLKGRLSAGGASTGRPSHGGVSTSKVLDMLRVNSTGTKHCSAKNALPGDAQRKTCRQLLTMQTCVDSYPYPYRGRPPA